MRAGTSALSTSAAFSGSRTPTKVQTSATTTEELIPVPVITSAPTGNTDPATTTIANTDAKATAAKDLAAAELRLKSVNGQITSYEELIARELPLAERSKYLAKAIRLGSIRKTQSLIDELKKKAADLLTEIDRLKALI